jgi:hypothetical protein
MAFFWQAKYGEEIVCVIAYVIEAREQFSYCSDIVTQGAGTIDALAATLYNGKSWYFWWD